jgi:proteasome assembly chaperone (PAC2) family protein
MVLQRLDHPGDLERPVLVAGFDGWVDAGSAATLAMARLVEGAPVIATFDADRLYDYRARRPVLDIIDGTLVQLDWPELELRHRRLDGRDVLVLTGPEPDYAWRRLAESVVELAGRLRVRSWVSLGAVPATVAHTRPVPILATASADGLLPDGTAQGPAGNLRVPAAALSAIEVAVTGAGLPAVGFYAQVPHYVSGTYAAAAIELLEQLSRYLGVHLDPGELIDQAREQRLLLDTAASADERTRTYVERLEAMTDEQRLPEGDQLISEIERFLRERGGAGDGGPPGTE